MDMSTPTMKENATIPAPSQPTRSDGESRGKSARAAASCRRGSGEAGIPYAVVGGNAVASWVASVDEAAVRNTQDVDILLNRSDLEAAKQALAAAGFVFRHVKGIDMFLDGPGAKARDAVHIIFAGEKVRADDTMQAPEVDESEATTRSGSSRSSRW